MNQSTTHPIDESLADLPVGETAVIQRLRFDERPLNRLAALGLCEGVRVCVVRQGDPLILRVYGTRIGLAREWAEGITVHRCPRSRIAS